MIGIITSCTSEMDRLTPQLRQEAYDAYQLVSYPCERSSLTQKRRAALAPLIAEFTKIEKQAHGTIVGIDFALAKQMIDYEIAEGANWHCRFQGIPDSELDFMHQKGWLKQANSALAELVRYDSEKSKLPNWVYVADAGKFRSIARNIYDALTPQCQVVVEQNIPEFSYVHQAMRDLSLKLSNSPYGKHLEIAEEDSEYYRSITVVECSEPLSGQAGRASLRKREAWLVNEIRKLETLARNPRPL